MEFLEIPEEGREQMVDWPELIEKYHRGNSKEFEVWVFQRFKERFNNQNAVFPEYEDITVANLWKNGHRNVHRLPERNNCTTRVLILPACTDLDGLLEINNVRSLLTNLLDGRLLHINGIGNRTASAFLCLLRPNIFPVWDELAVKGAREITDDYEIGWPNGWPHNNFNNAFFNTNNYLEYLRVFKELKDKIPEREGYSLSLREIDQGLWARGKEIG